MMTEDIGTTTSSSAGIDSTAGLLLNDINIFAALGALQNKFNYNYYFLSSSNMYYHSM
jgi:hypothetical protein